MRLTAHKADAINRMAGRIRQTLKRCDPPMSDSLRLMASHMVREFMARAYTGETEIHPGMAKMAKWGKCSERQARRNREHLEEVGVIFAVSDAKGGQKSTRFWVDPDALIRLAMDLGANPHPDLVAEIRDHLEAISGRTWGRTLGRTSTPDTWPDICPPDTRRVSRLDAQQSGDGGCQ